MAQLAQQTRCLIVALACPAFLHAATQPLFNGRDLAGWQTHGPKAGSFSAADGQLVISGKGHSPNWIHTTNEYENFRLHLEYKLAQWAEAAVYLRAPRSDRPANAGMAILLAHDFHKLTTPYITGAVAGVLPPRATLPPSFEEWHKLDIELTTSRLTVTIDGKPLQDVALDTHPVLRHRLKRGVIGFPDMGHGWRIRNITIEELAPAHSFTALTPTQKRGASGEWRIAAGIVTGANGHSILYAPERFADFELTTVVRSHQRTNSGIFLRGSSDEKQYRGFEVQIYSPPDSVYPTGSIYGIERSTLQADLENRWFLMQIRVAGSRCQVWIDGQPVATTNNLPEPARKPGQIGLQIHMEDTWVEFRDLRIRALTVEEKDQ